MTNINDNARYWVGHYIEARGLNVTSNTKGDYDKLGMCRKAIYNFLNGRKGLSLRSLGKLAEGLDVPAHELLLPIPQAEMKTEIKNLVDMPPGLRVL